MKCGNEHYICQICKTENFLSFVKLLIFVIFVCVFVVFVVFVFVAFVFVAFVFVVFVFFVFVAFVCICQPCFPADILIVNITGDVIYISDEKN